MKRLTFPVRMATRTSTLANERAHLKSPKPSRTSRRHPSKLGVSGSPVKLANNLACEDINVIDLTDIPSRKRHKKNAAACCDESDKENADSEGGNVSKQLISSLKNIFPNATEELVAFSLSTVADDWLFERKLQFCSDILLGYLPRRHTDSIATATPAHTSKDGGIEIDVTVQDSKPQSSETGVLHHHWCLHKLSMHFPRAPMKFIRLALSYHGGELGETYRSLHHEYFKALAKDGGYPSGEEEKLCKGKSSRHWLLNGGLKLMTKPRSNTFDFPITSSIDFEKEWETIQLQFFEGLIGRNDHMINTFEGTIEQQKPSIECGCCFNDYLFEEMVQCVDGHLFCFGCVRRRLEESIFGTSQTHANVQCMDTNGCEESFPWTELQRCVPQETLSKYELRQAEDAISRAKLQGLVYCPFCQFPCEVDPDISILKCPNDLCMKESCICCKEPNHFPLKCEEVVKDSETNLRKLVEEEMTKALLRECSSCKTSLVKVDGCNKVICRCGQSMCYVCRKPIKDYNHFCQHPRQPNTACTQCDRCFLWEQELSNQVVKRARQFAMEEVAKKQPDFLKRRIGPSAEILKAKILR